MTDLQLFAAETTHGRARATDPVTSRDAARADRSRSRQAILDLFVDGKTFTPDEAAWILEPLGHRNDTVRSLMSRLAGEGLIVKVLGERRRTRAGCMSQVWVAEAAPRGHVVDRGTDE